MYPSLNLTGRVTCRIGESQFYRGEETKQASRSSKQTGYKRQPRLTIANHANLRVPVPGSLVVGQCTFWAPNGAACADDRTNKNRRSSYHSECTKQTEALNTLIEMKGYTKCYATT